MSSFVCKKCGIECIDSPLGYITGCKHYPADMQTLPADMEKVLYENLWDLYVDTNTTPPMTDREMLQMDAGEIGAGPALYEVTNTHCHNTLKAGDLVRLVEDPHYNNLLLRTDWTLHQLADEHGQYVHLRLVLIEARA